MKQMILSLTVMLSLAAVAGNGFERLTVDFSSAQSLDDEMKTDIKALISEHCQPIASYSKQINVFEKSVRYEKVDQGITDVYHTVGIEFIGRDNHNSLGYEEVTVVRFAGQNPTVDHVRVEDYTRTSACR